MTSETFIENKFSETTENIAKICDSCRAAKAVLGGYNQQEDIYKYLQAHHSSIGTDIHHNNRKKCTAFLVGYYDWLAEEYKDLPVVKVGGMPGVPSIPKISTPMKGMIGIIVAIGVIILMLIAIGYSGLGGSVGRVAESEHKRKRG